MSLNLLPVVTYHSPVSLHINLRIIIDSAFFLIFRHHIFFLSKLLWPCLFCFHCCYKKDEACLTRTTTKVYLNLLPVDLTVSNSCLRKMDVNFLNFKSDYVFSQLKVFQQLPISHKTEFQMLNFVPSAL